MPDAAKLVLTALLAVALAVAVFSPAPARPRPRTVAHCVLGGAGIYLAALLVALAGHVALATLLVGPRVAALTLAGWLSRAGDDRRGGDDEPEPDLPIDWDEFDRLRGEWERTTLRPLVLV